MKLMNCVLLKMDDCDLNKFTSLERTRVQSIFMEENEVHKTCMPKLQLSENLFPFSNIYAVLTYLIQPVTIVYYIVL